MNGDKHVVKQGEVIRVYYLFQRDPLGLGDEKIDVKETEDEHAREDEHDQGTDPISPPKKHVEPPASRVRQRGWG